MIPVYQTGTGKIIGFLPRPGGARPKELKAGGHLFMICWMVRGRHQPHRPYIATGLPLEELRNIPGWKDVDQVV